MIGIAFHVDHLRGHVLRLVSQGVDNDTTTDGAVRASRSRFCRTRDLQFPDSRVGRLQIESQNGRNRGSGPARFDSCDLRLAGRQLL